MSVVRSDFNGFLGAAVICIIFIHCLAYALYPRQYPSANNCLEMVNNLYVTCLCIYNVCYANNPFPCTGVGTSW